MTSDPKQRTSTPLTSLKTTLISELTFNSGSLLRTKMIRKSQPKSKVTALKRRTNNLKTKRRTPKPNLQRKLLPTLSSVVVVGDNPRDSQTLNKSFMEILTQPLTT